MNNELKNKNNSSSSNEFISIIDAVPDYMRFHYTGYPIRDEILIWWKIKYDKLIEVEDLEKSKYFVKKSLKLFAYSSLATFLIYKLASLISIKNTTLNSLHFIPRMIFKVGIISCCTYNLFLVNFFMNFSLMHSYFTKKYSERFKEYNKIGDPLIMNKSFYTYYKFTEDEKESRKLLYDKIKYQQEMLIKSSKEKEAIFNEKINHFLSKNAKT
jgi:hypothetical protein